METTKETVMKHQYVYCKYCGHPSTTVQLLTGSHCSKNPEGEYHVKYDGIEKSQYFCRYCGHPASTIQLLTGCSCRKNPNSKYCEPAL